MNFGINLSFAVKRWPEPMRSSMAEKISQSTMNWGIRIESAFGGPASYTYNNLLHPDIDGRRITIADCKFTRCSLLLRGHLFI